MGVTGGEGQEDPSSLEVFKHPQRFLKFLVRLRLRQPWIARTIQQDRAPVPLEHQPLPGDLDGGDLVGGGFGFDAGDGEEVLDGVGEAAVAVLPVFLEGGDLRSY